jgi:hypothetical protein
MLVPLPEENRTGFTQNVTFNLNLLKQGVSQATFSDER